MFVYFTAPGLSCGMKDLLVVVCGIYFPDQGSNLDPRHWELRVLATGTVAKYHLNIFDSKSTHSQ